MLRYSMPSLHQTKCQKCKFVYTCMENWYFRSKHSSRQAERNKTFGILFHYPWALDFFTLSLLSLLFVCLYCRRLVVIVVGGCRAGVVVSVDSWEVTWLGSSSSCCWLCSAASEQLAGQKQQNHPQHHQQLEHFVKLGKLDDTLFYLTSTFLFQVLPVIDRPEHFLWAAGFLFGFVSLVCGSWADNDYCQNVKILKRSFARMEGGAISQSPRTWRKCYEWKTEKCSQFVRWLKMSQRMFRSCMILGRSGPCDVSRKDRI